MNVAPSTAAEGTCGSCSSPLAAGQRYCLVCGERRAELPTWFRPPERQPAHPDIRVAAPLLTGRRSLGAVGTVVLACGVLIGAAVGPALTPASLAATAGQLIVVSTGPLGGAAGTVAAGSGAGGGGGGAASGGLAAPTGNVAAPPHRVVNRGGGAAPAAPAAAAAVPSAPAPAPTTPAQPTTPATPAPPAEDPTVAGTVVHLSHEGHGYAVVTKEGELIALHATEKEPKLGDKLKTTVKPLDNGTFEQLKAKVSGHSDTASFHGTVTFADSQAGVYTVSAPGVSLLLHLPPPPAPPADPAPPPPAVPAVGTLTTVDVAIKLPPPGNTDPAAKPQLEETKRVDGDPASGDLDLEAIVENQQPDPSTPPDPSHLIVSADDSAESPATLYLKIPPKLDVSKLKKPGTVISALVKLEADGTLTLVSAAKDP
ncbi:MAG: hypothetical protein QOC77_3589 [Thermoleophilaceae bacterium]|nr:hypothetical protein [Thermoleophilaceae bacterium]